jgi:hypothetical protein
MLRILFPLAVLRRRFISALASFAFWRRCSGSVVPIEVRETSNYRLSHEIFMDSEGKWFGRFAAKAHGEILQKLRPHRKWVSVFQSVAFVGVQ